MTRPTRYTFTTNRHMFYRQDKDRREVPVSWWDMPEHHRERILNAIGAAHCTNCKKPTLHYLRVDVLEFLCPVCQVERSIARNGR